LCERRRGSRRGVREEACIDLSCHTPTHDVSSASAMNVVYMFGGWGGRKLLVA
jgi:hypothetical protein